MLQELTIRNALILQKMQCSLNVCQSGALFENQSMLEWQSRPLLDGDLTLTSNVANIRILNCKQEQRSFIIQLGFSIATSALHGQLQNNEDALTFS